MPRMIISTDTVPTKSALIRPAISIYLLIRGSWRGSTKSWANLRSTMIRTEPATAARTAAQAVSKGGMMLADNDTGADRARPDEDGHGNRSGQALRIASQDLNGPGAAENKLKADQKKNQATEDLKRGKFRLHDIRKYGVPQDGETEKDSSCYQPGPDQETGKVPLIDLAYDINIDRG